MQHDLPTGGHDPSSTGAGTTPGSYAAARDVGDPRAYCSPDTPGMPAASSKTAHDRHNAAGREPASQLERARAGQVTGAVSGTDQQHLPFGPDGAA